MQSVCKDIYICAALAHLSPLKPSMYDFIVHMEVRSLEVAVNNPEASGSRPPRMDSVVVVRLKGSMCFAAQRLLIVSGSN